MKQHIHCLRATEPIIARILSRIRSTTPPPPPFTHSPSLIITAVQKLQCVCVCWRVLQTIITQNCQYNEHNWAASFCCFKQSKMLHLHADRGLGLFPLSKRGNQLHCDTHSHWAQPEHFGWIYYEANLKYDHQKWIHIDGLSDIHPNDLVWRYFQRKTHTLVNFTMSIRLWSSIVIFVLWMNPSRTK